MTLLACAALVTAPARAVIAGKFGEFGVHFRAAALEEPVALKYHGGPVISASDTYAIYWDPVGAYHNDWMTLIDPPTRSMEATSWRSTPTSRGSRSTLTSPN